MKKGVLLIIAGVVGVAVVHEFQSTQGGKKNRLKTTKTKKKEKKVLCYINGQYWDTKAEVNKFVDRIPSSDKTFREKGKSFESSFEAIKNHLDENYLWA